MSLKIPLVLYNVLALLIVFSMFDHLERGIKFAVLVTIVVNLILLLSTNPNANKVTHRGALISLIAIIAFVISWSILTFFCVVANYNGICNTITIVVPLIYCLIGIGFLSLPFSYFVGLFKRS